MAHLQPVGELPADERRDLSIGLPLRNREALTNLLKNLYDPANPQFHRYLTSEQFADKFGPTAEDYSKVVAFAESSGFTVHKFVQGRMLLPVSGTVAQIERAFGIKMHVYRHPTESRNFFAPDQEPSVNEGLPILNIGGLNDFVRPHRIGSPSVPLDRTGTGWQHFFAGNDFRNAYAPGVNLDGSGQVVGILALDGFYLNDIGLYFDKAGLNRPNLEIFLMNGFDGTPGSGAFETTLDIDMVGSMAPGLSKISVYEADVNDINSPNYILYYMATLDTAKQLSCSWGYAIDGTTDQLFQQFAAQGQSFLQASGDNGSTSGPIQPPCDHPYVTSVGGTDLVTVTNGGPWVSESTWLLSGGGISTSYPIPVWQQGIDMTANLGSTTWRNIPDVAMLAQEIYVVSGNGGDNVASGTSAAAPLWAGLIALANQQADINAIPPIGYLNPSLYAIGKSANYSNCFHDITAGNNAILSSDPNRYFAMPGYDLCTGWGTPKGSNLLNALAPFTPLRITPMAGGALVCDIGRASLTIPGSLSLTNAAATPMTWSVGSSADWLDVSPVGGTLVAGEHINVTISANVVANYLPAGDYAADLWFTNLTTGLVYVRPFTLTINPLLQNGGFESNSFAGWTLSGDSTKNVVVDTAGFSPAVHSGSYGGKFGQVGSLAYLSQTISTVAGESYLLSLWLDSSANPNPPRKTTPNQFLVSWAGNTLLNLTNIAVIGWTNLQFIVTATGTSSVLQLGLQDDVWALGLDDITLQPISPPSCVAISDTGATLTSTWAAVAGLNYRMQYKTDLLQPVWTDVSGIVTANTIFVTQTNLITADPQRFYRLIRF